MSGPAGWCGRGWSAPWGLLGALLIAAPACTWDGLTGDRPGRGAETRSVGVGSSDGLRPGSQRPLGRQAAQVSVAAGGTAAVEPANGGVADAGADGDVAGSRADLPSGDGGEGGAADRHAVLEPSCVDADGDGYWRGCEADPARPGPDCDDADPGTGPCARNVILFVGDGMGFAQVRAARSFASGNREPLVFETLPRRGQITTASASSPVTDSAAAATAMATGVKVANGVLSLEIPGGGGPLETVLERRQRWGQSTGLVTIHDPVTAATLAAFGAHRASRSDASGIASDYRVSSRSTLIFGGADGAVVPNDFAAAGYQVVASIAALLDVDRGEEARILGLFPHDAPSLAERTAIALERLAGDPEGFFLLVEQANTDRRGHANDLAGVVEAVLALDTAVAMALAWAGGRDDTLVIVTADHETGGLVCAFDDHTLTTAGVMPSDLCSFSTGSHTAANVPVFAVGFGAERVVGTLDNTELFALTAGRLEG